MKHQIRATHLLQTYNLKAMPETRLQFGHHTDCPRWVTAPLTLWADWFKRFAAAETCFHKNDTGASYRGSVNFTTHHDGECENTDKENALEFNPELQYVLDGNNCVNLRLWLEAPFCSVNGVRTVCGIPECGKSIDLFNISLLTLGHAFFGY